MACTMSVFGLYQVALWFVVLGLQLLNQAMALISGLAQAQFELKNETAAAADIAQKIDEAHYTLTVSWYVSFGLAVFLLLSYIPGILKNYRTHLLNLFAGKKEPLPPHLKLQTEEYIVGSLKYIGFQVAFFLTGYISVQLLLFLLIGGLAMLIRAIIWNMEAILINIILELALPSAVVGMSVMFCQTLFVRLLFVQDKIKEDDDDRPLAIQHKVWFLIFSFVMMFLNTLYGIIMAIIRYLIGIVSLALFLPRIDLPILMPSMPDLIYNVYVGNMHTENAHSNPVLVTFCHLMVFDVLKSQKKHRKMKRLTDRGFTISQDISTYSDLEESTDEEKGPTQPIGLFKYFRWHLAITLINNPSLIHLRKRPAVSLDEEVTMQNGELKTVAIGAEGGAQHNMMPHMVEVIKRHHLDKKRSSIDATNVADLLVDDIKPTLSIQETKGSSSSKTKPDEPSSFC
ncbi:stimulated by retinoic acid gene 6 protein-like [Asterias rubens]|uniref:stimulated by retinoic acid gene 6 protein-like n=1 Tax=Asterias rubens TaxID=7604 RepID=UPI0014559613|nr:stimulated by retinoic acid gene 6 protein-like [Asterias rubens]